MQYESALPPIREFDLLPWQKSFGTDYYGALDVAAEHCGLRQVPRCEVGTWQHGAAGPWEQVQPETFVCLSPRAIPCFVARRDEALYLRAAGYKRVRDIGLPIIYTAAPNIKRIPGSLLVMPTHSLPTDDGSPGFNEYVSQIAGIRGRFAHVAACVSANCIAKGFWAPQFEGRGISVVPGAWIADANALRRMRVLLESFEYVTTNGCGSHLFYALYFGAKVSLWGNPSPLTRENMLKDGTWAAFPDAADRYLSEETRRKAEQYLGPLRVEPWAGVQDRELGAWVLGSNNKLSPSELRQCFGWTPLRILGASLQNTLRNSKVGRMASLMKRQLISCRDWKSDAKVSPGCNDEE